MAKTFDVEKQFRFALATALTAVANKARAATVTDIKQTFTVRNTWVTPSNAMGIKVLPATKNDLTAVVATRAGWLVDHETGDDRLPRGQHRTVPTANVRRTKRDLVASSQKPKNLRGKAFKLPLRNGGEGLFARTGRKGQKRLVLLYFLIERARIKKQSTLSEQTVKAFERNFDREFEARLEQALRTARR